MDPCGMRCRRNVCLWYLFRVQLGGELVELSVLLLELLHKELMEEEHGGHTPRYAQHEEEELLQSFKLYL